MTDAELAELLGSPRRRDEAPGDVPPEAPQAPIQEEVTEEPAEAAEPADAPAEAPQTDAEPPVPAEAVPAPPAPEPPRSTLFDAPMDVPPPEAPPVREPKHIFLRVLAVLTTLVFLGFAVFCVVWDVKNGTTSGGGYKAGDTVHIEIVHQNRPSTNDAAPDGDGRYTIEGIAEHCMPSIVEIYTYGDSSGGSGSGIILTEDGYIATNSHVVAGGSKWAVHLFDETQSVATYDAILVGHDTKTDLAVLKIPAKGLTPATLGNSDQVKLGETVCALGNPAGLSGSITTGIISGMNRKVRAQSTNFRMDCFQTDAAISPGNSGGALVNLFGQVIGITSSKYSSSLLSGGGYEGLGFAIAINQALPILQELMEQGYVSGRVRMGIKFLEHDYACAQLEQNGETVPAELKEQGILIMEIDSDSDLANTIFQPGDWILTMNGQPVTDYDSINKAIEGAVAGDPVHCRCGHLEDGRLSTYEIDFRLMEDQSGEY